MKFEVLLRLTWIGSTDSSDVTASVSSRNGRAPWTIRTMPAAAVMYFAIGTWGVLSPNPLSNLRHSYRL